MTEPVQCQHFGSFFCGKKTKDSCSVSCSRKLFYDECLDDDSADLPELSQGEAKEVLLGDTAAESKELP